MADYTLATLLPANAGIKSMSGQSALGAADQPALVVQLPIADLGTLLGRLRRGTVSIPGLAGSYRAKSFPWSGVRQVGTDAGSPNFTHAEVSITFGIDDSSSTRDRAGNLITIRKISRRFVESILIPDDVYWWDAEGEPEDNFFLEGLNVPQSSVAKVVSGKQLIWTVSGLKDLDMSWVDSCIGCVNSASFEGYSAGLIRFDNAEDEEVDTVDPETGVAEKTYSVTLTFSWRPVSWQMYYVPQLDTDRTDQTAGFAFLWLKGTTSDVPVRYYPYKEADLQAMFDAVKNSSGVTI